MVTPLNILQASRPYYPLFWVLLSLLLLSSCNNRKTETPLSLNGEWEVTTPDIPNFGTYPATVPGTIHTDLLQQGIIPDPFKNANEELVQWVEKQRWVYTKTFDCNPELLNHQVVDLTFEGLDTYCEVTLNGHALLFDEELVAHNMFRSWQANVKPLLKQKKNQLVLTFHPAALYDSLVQEESSITLPDSRGFSRKAAYQYGWDWGPRLITCGAYRPITLKGWSDFNIDDVKIKTTIEQESDATLLITVVLNALTASEGTITLTSPQKEVTPVTIQPPIQQGVNRITFRTTIAEPQLWYPRDLGEQPLYTFNITVSSEKWQDETTITTGLRTVELVTEEDSEGSSFFLKCNDIPVFAKGANYIPPDNFLPRVSKADYRKLLLEAAEANFNMLRVWGGGVYPNDYFFHLCDSLGIMVWQDFMFACNMYPNDTAFFNNVSMEAMEQVNRTKHHPSLVLWCGNNEVKNGWEDWGWQDALGYSKTDSLALKHAYDTIFEEILPQMVNLYSPSTPYWTSSPLWGWGHDECNTEGDSHYWGVWWGEEPFEMYEERVPRFMSEFGFQSYPSYSTLCAWIDSSSCFRNSPAMAIHQKHPRGEALIASYMQDWYPVPSDFETFCYVSQLLQAEGVGLGIEAHRRARPYCMGSLFWQFNDCWPVVSWSCLDYDNQPKALYYKAKSCFENLMISTEEKEHLVAVFVVNDKKETIQGMLSAKLLSFEGAVTPILNQEVTLLPLQSNEVATYNFKYLSAEQQANNLLLITFTNEENELSYAHYFEKPKALSLPEEQLTIQVDKNSRGALLTINSPVLIKNLFLSSEKIDGKFENNFMDIYPNTPVKIQFTSSSDFSSEEFYKQLRHLSLNQAIRE